MAKASGKNSPLISLASDLEQKALSKMQDFIETLITDSFEDANSGEYFDTEDLLKIKVEEILDETKEKTEIEMNVLDNAKGLAGFFGVPEKSFTPVIVLFICALLHGKRNEAKALYNAIISTSMHVSTLESGPEKLGSLGGRPEHKRKGETLELATQRWEQLPKASMNSVANYVKEKLDEKYLDAPKLPTIKSWIKAVVQNT